VRRRQYHTKNAGQVGFAAGQVYFQVTCPAGRVSVEQFLRPDCAQLFWSKHRQIASSGLHLSRPF